MWVNLAGDIKKLKEDGVGKFEQKVDGVSKKLTELKEEVDAMKSKNGESENIFNVKY